MPLRELRNAFRRLLSRPAYAALSVVVLSLGLGACLFMLSVVDGLILRPLPFPDSDRLVAIGHAREGSGGIGALRSRDYARIVGELRSVDRIGQWEEMSIAVSRGGAQAATRYAGSSLSASMPGLLGMQPALGRAFSELDDRPGAELTLLLSDTVWREDFDASPDVLGTQLVVNGEPAIIIGVMPPGFAFPFVGEAWLPRRFAVEDGIETQVMARLAADANLPQLRAELDALALRLGSELEGARDNRRLNAVPVTQRFVSQTTRQYLWLMLGAGALVLLLACANAANLQLVQAISRQRELAVRSALGASRAGLLREMLSESLILSLVACAIALLLAHLGVAWLMAVLTASGDAPPYFVQLGVDLRLLGFALLAAFLTTAIAGLAPALRASRVDVQIALRDGDKGSGGGFARLARGLVLAEIALTVVLLVGAGTLVRGLQQVMAFDFGTRADPDSILTARVGLFSGEELSAAQLNQFFERVTQRLRENPQVLAVSAATALPGTMGDGHEMVAAEGQYAGEQSALQAQHARIDDGFLETYGIRLIAGRAFDARDQADSEPVVIIDRRMADRLWPGRDAVGQGLLINPQREKLERATVVGVTDALHLEDADDPVLPILLVPMRQHAVRFATLAVRLAGDAQDFAPQLSAAVRAENAEVPVYWVQTQADAIRAGRVGPVILTQLFGALGLLALLLAAVGLYGVLAFVVAQREREIGIRRAIGADHRSVVLSVAGRLGVQVAVGMSIGLLLALPWSALLESPELQTRGLDPVVFLAVAVLVVLMAAFACLVPLRCALRIHPSQALRSD